MVGVWLNILESLDIIKIFLSLESKYYKIYVSFVDRAPEGISAF